MPSKVIQDLSQVDPLDEDYMTALQVAALLKLQVKQLHELVREGMGPPHVQLSPGRRVFPRSGVRAWLESCRSEVSSS